jgi:hypothetical protein
MDEVQRHPQAIDPDILDRECRSFLSALYKFTDGHIA